MNRFSRAFIHAGGAGTDDAPLYIFDWDFAEEVLFSPLLSTVRLGLGLSRSHTAL